MNKEDKHDNELVSICLNKSAWMFISVCLDSWSKLVGIVKRDDSEVMFARDMASLCAKDIHSIITNKAK